MWITPRAGRRATSTLVLGLVAGSLLLPGPALADETVRHWGIGWDGRQGAPLLRWRPSPAWDVTLAAGPDDAKDDTETRYYSSDYSPQQQGNPENGGSKRESGWVGLTGGRRMFSEGRFSLAGALGLSLRWTNTQDTYREPTTSTPPDALNSRESSHSDIWAVDALLRPSFAVSSRFFVEFDCGLQLSWASRTRSVSRWFDVSPDYVRTEESEHSTVFRTIGGFDFWKLKFVFWL